MNIKEKCFFLKEEHTGRKKKKKIRRTRDRMRNKIRKKFKKEKGKKNIFKCKVIERKRKEWEGKGREREGSGKTNNYCNKEASNNAVKTKSQNKYYFHGPVA